MVINCKECEKDPDITKEEIERDKDEDITCEHDIRIILDSVDYEEPSLMIFEADLGEKIEPIIKEFLQRRGYKGKIPNIDIGFATTVEEEGFSFMVTVGEEGDELNEK